jgi:hypothetical protein
MKHYPNLFVYGLSGSGKDSISNYLRDKHGYIKLRLSKTIKQIICETKGIDTDYLETMKRDNPKLRMAHWETGMQLDNLSHLNTGVNHSVNRLLSFYEKTALDFELVKDLKDKPQIICDCRIGDEIEVALDKKYVGIWLMRKPNEFVGDGKHKTEQNFFNLENEKNILNYVNKVFDVPQLVICNVDKASKEDFEKYIAKCNEYNKKLLEQNIPINENITFCYTTEMMQKILITVDKFLDTFK